MPGRFRSSRRTAQVPLEHRPRRQLAGTGRCPSSSGPGPPWCRLPRSSDQSLDVDIQDPRHVQKHGQPVTRAKAAVNLAEPRLRAAHQIGHRGPAQPRRRRYAAIRSPIDPVAMSQGWHPPPTPNASCDAVGPGPASGSGRSGAWSNPESFQPGSQILSSVLGVLVDDPGAVPEAVDRLSRVNHRAGAIATAGTAVHPSIDRS